MIEMRETQEAGETPAQITVSMIDQDLKDGISKPEMAIKYGIKPWEVDEMFKHPDLKGRRPARKRVLSFKFVDDTLPLNSGDIAEEQAEEIDPNQITLDEAIDEAIESVEEVKDQMQETQEAILDMLSPTEFETPEETLLKVAHEPEITGIPNGDTMSDTDDEEYVEVEEEDDNTFEL
tara:strand:+ start:260 stop:793 length:534 start_codon:yes stop_codon:yes gene_type:complete